MKGKASQTALSFDDLYTLPEPSNIVSGEPENKTIQVTEPIVLSEIARVVLNIIIKRPGRYESKQPGDFSKSSAAYWDGGGLEYC